MMLGKPAHQEVKAALAAFRAQAVAPPGPPLDDRGKAQTADDLGVGGVFEQANCGPVAIEASQPIPPVEEGLKVSFVEIVVPEVGRPRHRESLAQPGVS